MIVNAQPEKPHKRSHYLQEDSTATQTVLKLERGTHPNQNPSSNDFKVEDHSFVC